MSGKQKTIAKLVNHQLQNHNKLLVKDSFVVVLDSHNATTYNNGSMHSNVTFMLEDSIKKDKALQMTCSLVNFICPISYYLINRTNNELAIFTDDRTYLTTVVIPFGNYDASSLINFIDNFLTHLIPDLEITLDNITNKFTFSSATIPFTISGSRSSIGEVMGFDSNDYSTTYDTANTLTMPFCCNFSGLNNMNVQLLNMNTRNIDSYNKSNSPIIASIPINAPQSGVVIYEKKFDFAFDVNEETTDYLQIRLVDDLQNEIDLNNQHFNITIQFDKLSEIDINKPTFFDYLETPYQSNPLYKLHHGHIASLEHLEDTEDVDLMDEDLKTYI